MKFASNSGLMEFLDKSKFKWNEKYPNHLGPFYRALEKFPEREEILNWKVNRRKCLCLVDKNPGIFAYSDKILVVSYSIIVNNGLEIYVGQSVLLIRKFGDYWEIDHRKIIHSIKAILFSQCGRKEAKLEAAKIKSTVKRLAIESENRGAL